MRSGMISTEQSVLIYTGSGTEAALRIKVNRCRGSCPPTVHKCETTFERLPLRGIPMYTLRIHVILTHVCYNRYPPTCGFKNIVQYSTACLTVWLCRICLRHTGDRLYTQPKQTWRLPDTLCRTLISNRPLPRPPLPQPPAPPYICRIFTLILRKPGSLP
jgi:hypothetical protein